MKNFRMGLVIFLVFAAACAAVPRTALTPSELSLLKGEWEGSRSIVWGRVPSQDFTVMEIFNESVPLKGKITFPMLEGPYPKTLSFENGLIDGEGNLSVQISEVVKIKLSLYKEDKRMKLEGFYWHRDNQGKLTLYKK